MKQTDIRGEGRINYKKEDLIFKPISDNSEEMASIYDERYKYRKPKKDRNLDEKIAQAIDDKTIANNYKYEIKPMEKSKSELEKVNDKLGLKASVAAMPNNFSSQVNVEIDKNKILEPKKKDIPTISPIINVKNDKVLNPPVKDISNKKEEPKKEIIKIATSNYDRLTSKLISAIEEQRKNTKTVVENKNLNYVVKPSEKIKVPEAKKNNNDIRVPPQNVTFSPQVNVNMGGVVIKNEADIEKTAEMAKQKIEKELRNYVQITK